MATLENINICVTGDISQISDSLKELDSQIDKTLSGQAKFESSSGKPKEGFFNEIQGLDNNVEFSNASLDKVFSGANLSDANKEALKGFDNLKSILEDKLSDLIEIERTRLEGQNVPQEEIDARLEVAQKLGDKKIDELVEDFTDTLEEAAKDLSQKISAAFVQMALDGEFSIKKLGDIFLKTFLDIVAKELIQKPLEDLLGSVIGAVIGGGAPTGGNAAGGDIAGGVPTFINEQGQEIFIPHTPGRIVDADQTKRMFGSGQGVVVHQNLSFDTAIKNDMIGTILQASPLLVEQTKVAVIETLQGRRF